MMVDVNKLKGKMAENGFIQNDLASAIGIDRSTLNRKLRTGEDFSINEANKIAQVLSLTKNEAMSIFFKQIVA